MPYRVLTCAAIISMVLGLTTCSGGGNNSDYFVAAWLDLSCYPQDIYVGERTIVTAYIEDVNPQGVVVKFRYPDSLSYVPESAFLDVEGEIINVGPMVNAHDKKDSYIYLVYVFSQDTFGKHLNGKLFFHLLAEKVDKEARVEAAATMRDTNLPDTEQFDIRDPQFGTDTAVTVEIKK
jgi:hypothetical protein